MGLRARPADAPSWRRGGISWRCFARQGADNITWLWTDPGQDVPGTGPVASWWPGAGYVTWVGIDGYYYRPTDTFAERLRSRPSAQVRALHRKAVLCPRPPSGPK